MESQVVSLMPSLLFEIEIHAVLFPTHLELIFPIRLKRYVVE